MFAAGFLQSAGVLERAIEIKEQKRKDLVSMGHLNRLGVGVGVGRRVGVGVGVRVGVRVGIGIGESVGVGARVRGFVAYRGLARWWLGWWVCVGGG